MSAGRSPGGRRAKEEERGLRAWVRNSPWWAVSIGLHIIILLVATLCYFDRLLNQEEDAVKVDIHAAKASKFQDLEREKEKGKKDEDKPTAETEKAEELPESASSGQPEEVGEMASSEGGGSSAKSASMGIISDSPGGRPGGWRPGRRRRAAPRAAKKESFVEDDSLRAALRWLARHQDRDGSWSVTGFPANCGRYGFRDSCKPEGPAGNEQYRVGVTGLALLALLGGGYLPSSREPIAVERPGNPAVREAGARGGAATFGEAVGGAIRYLLRAQAPSGMIGPEVDRWIYNHLIATLALCEACSLTDVPFLAERAERAVRFTVAARNPRLGWRYGIQPADSDSSVTGWAVLALKSAEAAGLPVDRAALDGARLFLESSTVQARIAPRLLADPAARKPLLLTGYQGRKDAGKLVSVPGVNDSYLFAPSMTATMVLSAHLLDRKPGPRPRAAVDTLMEFLPARWVPGDRATWKSVDFYYWYHGTYALLLAAGADDPRWKRWTEALGAALDATQNLKEAKGECREGSWDPADRWSSEGGRVYATAMAALTLEAERRTPQLLAAAKTGRPLLVESR